MVEPLQDLSASALEAAIEANSCGLYAAIGRLPWAELHDDPGLLWFATGLPIPYYNGILRAQFTPEEADARIQHVLSYFRRRGLPMGWRVWPSTTPADLGRRLEAHGLVYTNDLPGMAADLLALNEGLPALSGLTIERVGDAAALRQWVRNVFTASGHTAPSDSTLRAAYQVYAGLAFGGDPSFRFYTGHLHGRAVATSLCFLGAGVAGMYAVSTQPQARRQGIGAAMTLAPLRDAPALGHRVGILHSSLMGLNLYRTLGFREYGTLRQYTWTGPGGSG